MFNLIRAERERERERERRLNQSRPLLRFLRKNLLPMAELEIASTRDKWMLIRSGLLLFIQSWLNLLVSDTKGEIALGNPGFTKLLLSQQRV